MKLSLLHSSHRVIFLPFLATHTRYEYDLVVSDEERHP
jgi:hypothetical protein